MFIAIASGKGGTGKTLISTSLALSAEKCTYVDLDVEDPNGYIFLKPDIKKVDEYKILIPEINEQECSFCAKCAKSCVYHAITMIPQLKRVMFFKELCHSCGVCSYVCPVEEAIKEVEMPIGRVRMGNSGKIKFIEGRLNIGHPSGVPLISGIIDDYLDNEQLLIVDSSPGTSCPVVETLKECDFVLLVTEPNPFGLNDLRLTVELVQDMGLNSGIIINKDIGKKNLIDTYAQEVGIPIMLRIPYKIEIQKSYSRGIPLIEYDPKIKIEFKSVLKEIIGNE